MLCEIPVVLRILPLFRDIELYWMELYPHLYMLRYSSATWVLKNLEKPTLDLKIDRVEAVPQEGEWELAKSER